MFMLLILLIFFVFNFDYENKPVGGGGYQSPAASGMFPPTQPPQWSNYTPAATPAGFFPHQGVSGPRFVGDGMFAPHLEGNCSTRHCRGGNLFLLK